MKLMPEVVDAVVLGVGKLSTLFVLPLRSHKHSSRELIYNCLVGFIIFERGNKVDFFLTILSFLV